MRVKKFKVQIKREREREREKRGGSNGSINSLFLSAFVDSEKYFMHLGKTHFMDFQIFLNCFSYFFPVAVSYLLIFLS